MVLLKLAQACKEKEEKQEKLVLALADAKRATVLCRTFAKAHFRVGQISLALGDKTGREHTHTHTQLTHN